MAHRRARDAGRPARLRRLPDLPCAGRGRACGGRHGARGDPGRAGARRRGAAGRRRRGAADLSLRHRGRAGGAGPDRHCRFGNRRVPIHGHGRGGRARADAGQGRGRCLSAGGPRYAVAADPAGAGAGTRGRHPRRGDETGARHTAGPVGRRPLPVGRTGLHPDRHAGQLPRRHGRGPRAGAGHHRAHRRSGAKRPAGTGNAVFLAIPAAAAVRHRPGLRSGRGDCGVGRCRAAVARLAGRGARAFDLRGPAGVVPDPDRAVRAGRGGRRRGGGGARLP